MEANIRFAYAADYDIDNDIAVITDSAGRIIQISIDEAVKLAELITLNTMAHKRHTLVSGLKEKNFLL